MNHFYKIGYTLQFYIHVSFVLMGIVIIPCNNLYKYNYIIFSPLWKNIIQKILRLQLLQESSHIIKLLDRFFDNKNIIGTNSLAVVYYTITIIKQR